MQCEAGSFSPQLLAAHQLIEAMLWQSLQIDTYSRKSLQVTNFPKMLYSLYKDTFSKCLFYGSENAATDHTLHVCHYSSALHVKTFEKHESACQLPSGMAFSARTAAQQSLWSSA